MARFVAVAVEIFLGGIDVLAAIQRCRLQHWSVAPRTLDTAARRGRAASLPHWIVSSSSFTVVPNQPPSLPSSLLQHSYLSHELDQSVSHLRTKTSCFLKPSISVTLHGAQTVTFSSSSAV